MLPAMDSTEVSLQSCPECAAQMPQNAGFCPGCGRPMEVRTRAEGKVGILPERVAGGIAYLSFVPAVVFLLLEPYRRNCFARFHAAQCLLLWGTTIVVAALVRLAGLLFSIIPSVGPLLFVVTVVLAILAAVLTWLVLVVKALQGEMFELPVLGNFARRYAIPADSTPGPVG
jgi:uncharacterized membrane protein